MGHDRAYRYGWHPDTELAREPSHDDQVIPGTVDRRQQQRDLAAGVNAFFVRDAERTKRMFLEPAERALAEAASALSARRQRDGIQLLGEVARNVVAAGGTSTIHWFRWPDGLPDGAIPQEGVKAILDLCRQTGSRLRRHHLDAALSCIHEATYEAQRAERNQAEILEREAQRIEDGLTLPVLSGLVAEAEALATRPGSQSRRRMREIRRQWDDTPWLSDDGDQRVLQNRLDGAALIIFR